MIAHGASRRILRPHGEQSKRGALQPSRLPVPPSPDVSHGTFTERSGSAHDGSDRIGKERNGSERKEGSPREGNQPPLARSNGASAAGSNERPRRPRLDECLEVVRAENPDRPSQEIEDIAWKRFVAGVTSGPRV